jgi:hypothetical protein
MERVAAYADTDEPRELATLERELWTLLLALGRSLVALFLARQATRSRPAQYVHGGKQYRLCEERGGEIGTRFGKVPWCRPVGRLVGWRRQRCDLPVDRELGLSGGFSLGVILAVGRLCAQMAFANARGTFRETYEWAPSPRATLRMVDALGERARPFLDAAPPPEDDGDVLVIQVDGKGAPMISEVEYERRAQPRAKTLEATQRHQRRAQRRKHPRTRRTSGKKSKNAKVAVVGVIYTLRTTSNGVEGPIGKRMIATFESHDALFQWLLPQAIKRGYGTKRTLFLSDGSDHIWRGQQQYFPLAEACLDWYHVVEKFWDISASFFKAGSEAQKAWVGQMSEHLRYGRANAVLNDLRQRLATTAKTGPGNKWRRTQLGKTIAYLEEHAARLPYAEFRAHDWDIGSGAVEGAVRNLIGMRFDGPGMRWGRGRAERLLYLRCILLNDQWDAFVDYVSRESLTLGAQPIPAEPHTAKAAA